MISVTMDLQFFWMKTRTVEMRLKLGLPKQIKRAFISIYKMMTQWTLSQNRATELLRFQVLSFPQTLRLMTS
jgi:hypothetical protein